MKPEVQEALQTIDVEQYLEREGVDYRTSYGTRGLQLNLRECPSCGEGGFKTYINAETGLGNCFHGSCGAKFNRFWLIKAVSKLGGEALDEHIKTVAQQQGWLPRKEAPKLLRGALKLPTKTFRLPFEGRNLAYLQDRGVTIDSCQHFGLGFCEGGWWSYKLDSGEERWVSYGDRVIIPIADLDGEIVSFQGRDITGEKEPKYLFPVGYAVAGSHLYHGWAFVDGVTTHAIVGEGAFDAIAIHQALHNGPEMMPQMLALATFGMHLSDGPGGQLEKFKQLQERGLTTVTMMWDSEPRALIAACKAGLQLRSMGLKVRIAKLPPGKDPNEVDPEVVRQAIFKAETLDRSSAMRIMTLAAVSRC